MATPRRNFRRAVLGDLIEIPLNNGKFAYGQFVRRHTEPPRYGDLLSVFSGMFNERPSTFNDTIRTERFCTFFPVGAAVSQGIVKIVSNLAVPQRFAEWPIFNAYNRNQQTGQKTWFLWDGNTTRKLGTLPAKYIDAPMEECITFGLLVERIETGWNPRDEVD